jgi:hypothetical protein
MAVADFTAWKAGQSSGRKAFAWGISNSGLLATSFRPFWPLLFFNAAGTPTAPTTAVAPDQTSQYVVVPNPDGSGQWLAASEIGCGNANRRMQLAMVLCDILSVQGGLSGTVTTEQTTNLPTAALTRHTSGAGVMIGLHIHTAVGSTGTTASVRYTDAANGASRTTKDVVFGSSTANVAGQVIICPLQDGDKAPVSVEGVTLAATTGTAGAFGVVLFKPLAFLNEVGGTNSQREPYKNFLEAASSASPGTDACLVPMFFPNAGGTTGAIMIGGHVTYIQG